jgi:basic amino acid/polyamine antiporter, APA family
MSTQTPAAAEAPITPFIRKASGLVRDFSVWDSWIYNCLAINPIVSGTVSFFLVTTTYPRASLPLALLIAGAFCIFEAVAYSCFQAIMPRTGGDYLFQSRTFGGGFATIVAFTNSTFAQIFYMAIAGFLLATQIFSPFFLLMAAQFHVSAFSSIGTWMLTKPGVLTMGLVATAYAVYINAVGLRIYAFVQRYLFWIGNVCLLIAALILVFSSKSGFISNFNSFMSSNYHVTGAYGKIVAGAHGVNFGFSLKQTIEATVLAAFSLIYPAWGVQQAGEIRRANSLKSNLISMVGAEVACCAGLAILALLMIDRTGQSFLYASQTGFASGHTVLPVPPFFGFFVAVMGKAGIFIIIAAIMYLTHLMGNWPNACLGSTRTTLAMAFDRVLPERFGAVSSRWHTPVFAILAFGVVAIPLCVLYAYSSSFVALLVSFFLINVVSFAGTMLAAMVLPWRSRDVYQSTKVARYKVAGIPLISFAAAIWLVFAAFIAWQCLTQDAIGVNSTKGLIFLGAMYGASAIIYLAAKTYRGRIQGIDLRASYQQLPAE